MGASAAGRARESEHSYSQHLPDLSFTATADNGVPAACFLARVDERIPKPFEAATLLTGMQRLIALPWQRDGVLGCHGREPAERRQTMPSVTHYLDRAAWLQTRALTCVHQALDNPRPQRLSPSRRRQLLAFARQHLEKARLLLVAAQRATRDRALLALLDGHLARLQAVTDGIESKAGQEQRTRRRRKAAGPRQAG